MSGIVRSTKGLTLDPISSGTVANTAINVRDYGAGHGNAAQDDAAFRSALATGKHIYVPTGDYALLNASPISLSDDQGMFGEGHISVPGAGAVFVFGNRSYARGLTFALQSGFSGVPLYIYGVDGCRVSDCNFLYSAQNGITIMAGDGTAHLIVSGNYQTGGATFLSARGVNNSTIVGNRVYGVGISNIGFLGGSYNTVAGNILHGGKNAILFLSYKSLSALSVAGIRGNTVAGNAVYGTSEEGISFDCQANSSTDWPENNTIPIATVTSASDGATTTTINFSEGGGSTGFANGYNAIVTSGNAKGFVAAIVSSTATSITISRSNGSIGSILAAGDKILISLGILQNTITGNTVQGAGTIGIVLYGSCWHNVVSSNTVMDANMAGIGVWSVASESGGSHCYSGFNRVIGNSVHVFYKGGNAVTQYGIDVRTNADDLTNMSGQALTLRNPCNRIENNNIINQGIVLIDCWHPNVSGNEVGYGHLYTQYGTSGLIEGTNYVAGTLTTFTAL